MTTKLTTMKEKFFSCHLILKSFFYSKGAIFMQNFPTKLNVFFFREKLFSDKKEKLWHSQYGNGSRIAP